MRTCWESFEAYAFRALGREFGERLLPRGLDITFCDQVFLIGSGLIWNVYFAAVAIAIGFGLAVAVAMARFSENPWLSRAAAMFIFVFRGSPLFIQFFFFYSAFVLLPRSGIDIPLGFITLTVDTSALTTAQVGGVLVLVLNTTAYSAELFYGAAEGQKPPPSGSGQAVLDPSDRSLKFSNRKEGIRQKPSRGGGMADKELCSVCEEYLAEWYCKKCDRKICQVPFLLPLATQTLEKIFLSSWKITSFSTRRAPTSKGHEAIIRSSACLFPQY